MRLLYMASYNVFYCFACFRHGGISPICTGLELYVHPESISVSLCWYSSMTTSHGINLPRESVSGIILPRQTFSVVVWDLDIGRPLASVLLTFNKKFDIFSI